MAITRDQKTAQVADLTQKMQNASSVIFAHYIGLTVADLSALRGKLRLEDAELRVAKKTLIRLAAKEAKAPEIADDLLPGPVACIFSYKEPTSGASVAFSFGKDHPQVQLIGGIFSGKLLSTNEARELATIPSRPVLLATFMSMLNAPLTQFAGAVSSPLISFARALQELAKQKEASTPTSGTPAPTTESAPSAESSASPLPS